MLSAVTIVTIMHAYGPLDESSLWVVPGIRDTAALYELFAETAPADALRILGPAKNSVIKELTVSLSKLLVEAGIEIQANVLADD